MPLIKLKSIEGLVFRIDMEVACVSATFRSLLKDIKNVDLDVYEFEDMTILLPKINATTLRNVIDWAKHHKDDPEDKEYNTDDIPEWDRQFLNVDKENLFEIILAAKYLDIKNLFQFACKTVPNTHNEEAMKQIRKMH